MSADRAQAHSLIDSCVLVTGATSGIGRELVVQLVKDGNFVVACGRNKDALNRLAADLGSRVKPLLFDVTDTNALPATAKQLADITDYLDCVIAVAGICEYEDDVVSDVGLYERVFNTNFLGVVRTLHLTKPLLDKSRVQAQFVAVGSLSSVIPFPRAEAYGASKSALEYFVKSARIDLSYQRLQVSLARPGFVSTKLTKDNDFPMPFLLTPEQAATRIIDGIKKRKLIIDFPRRLSWPLRVLSLFSGLWIHVLGPRLTRAK